MRRLEYLINDTRLSTDNLDTNGIKDREFIRYYNDAVKMVQLLIFKNQPLCSHFLAEQIYTSITPDAELDLPSDCYADNGIATVEGRFGISDVNGGYRPIRRVWQEDRAVLFGYITRNKKLIITGQNINSQLEAIRLTYFKRKPRFDKRWGTIASVGGSVVNLSGVTDSDLSLIDDTISIVDGNGVVIQDNIKVTSYSLPTSLTVSSTTPLSGSVTSGLFIVSGGYSTTVCDLPDEVEPYLQSYVEFSVKHRNNYTDAIRQKAWTDEQRSAIVDLFSNNTKEITAPPITDTAFLEI
jgi:hypothetical protein